jgi:small subunit ribosomal protein S20
LAHPLSAIKRHRQSLTRRERNKARVTAVRSAIRETREQITAGSADESERALRTASSTLDRAARKGTLHPNNAARRKSRIARQLNALREGRTVEAPKRATRPRASTRKPRAAKS